MTTFVELLKAILYGIVEGITEWLPISSTGHMILVDELWRTENHPVLTAEFMEMFTVVIQLGAILAVIWLLLQALALPQQGKAGQAFPVCPAK